MHPLTSAQSDLRRCLGASRDTRCSTRALPQGGATASKHKSGQRQQSRGSKCGAVEPRGAERSGEERVTVVRKHRTDEGTVGDNYHALLRLIVPHHAHIRRHIPTSAPPVLWLYYLLFSGGSPVLFSFFPPGS